jgi:hypothetical protein
MINRKTIDDVYDAITDLEEEINDSQNIVAVYQLEQIKESFETLVNEIYQENVVGEDL